MWSTYWPSTSIGVVSSVFAMWGSFHLGEKNGKMKPQQSTSFLSAKRSHLHLHLSYFQNSFEDRCELTGVGLYRFGGREEQKVPRQPSRIHKHRQALQLPPHNRSPLPLNTGEDSLLFVKPLTKASFLSNYLSP